MLRRSLNRVLIASAVAAAGAACELYRRDLAGARLRVAVGSRIADTPIGPIEYADAADGVPVLAVHGAGGGFDQTLVAFGTLARRGARVIAMSRFGYLRTPLPEDASAAAQADAHAMLLDALGIDRAAILAASAGAPSALQFAIRHPDRCTALALLVPIAWSPSYSPPPASTLSPFVERAIVELANRDFAFWAAIRGAPDLMIRFALATPLENVYRASHAERTRVHAILRALLPVRERTAGLVNDARIAATLARCDLDRIVAPTIVVSARDDLFGTFGGARYTAGQIRGARFVGYPDGGHLWVGHHDEVVEAFARLFGLAPAPLQPRRHDDTTIPATISPNAAP